MPYSRSSRTRLCGRQKVERSIPMSRLFSISVLVLALAGISLAQSAAEPADNILPMSFHAPFAFYVGNTQFAAGDYTVTMDSRVGVTNVRGTGGAAVVWAVPDSRPGAIQGHPSLTFNKYGEDKYFLAKFDDGRGLSEVTIPKSKTEREIVSARVVASSGGASKIRVLASVR
jgi:hypothetical protein